MRRGGWALLVNHSELDYCIYLVSEPSMGHHTHIPNAVPAMGYYPNVALRCIEVVMTSACLVTSRCV